MMAAAPSSQDCTVVELRQYTLHPGRREALIELFDREFVETQEAVGMRVIGQFRDAMRPDRFVWLRGFADMGQRRDALAAFYGGPTWAANSGSANATMIDFDDVLLLRPAWRGSGVAVQQPRPPAETAGERRAWWTSRCSICAKRRPLRCWMPPGSPAACCEKAAP